MNIAGAIIGGILGTVGMVGFILACPTRAGLFKLDIAGYVGSIFTAKSTLARSLGMEILTFDGAVIAVICAYLWDNNIGSATWVWGLVFGAVLGVLSLLVMLILDRIHPRASRIEFESKYIISLILWLGHLVYGLITVLVYNAF
jgi:hypothetical protein